MAVLVVRDIPVVRMSRCQETAMAVALRPCQAAAEPSGRRGLGGCWSPATGGWLEAMASCWGSDASFSSAESELVGALKGSCPESKRNRMLITAFPIIVTRKRKRSMLIAVYFQPKKFKTGHVHSIVGGKPGRPGKTRPLRSVTDSCDS